MIGSTLHVRGSDYLEGRVVGAGGMNSTCSACLEGCARNDECRIVQWNPVGLTPDYNANARNCLFLAGVEAPATKISPFSVLLHKSAKILPISPTPPSEISVPIDSPIDSPSEIKKEENKERRGERGESSMIDDRKSFFSLPLTKYFRPSTFEYPSFLSPYLLSPFALFASEQPRCDEVWDRPEVDYVFDKENLMARGVAIEGQLMPRRNVVSNLPDVYACRSLCLFGDPKGAEAGDNNFDEDSPDTTEAESSAPGSATEGEIGGGKPGGEGKPGNEKCVAYTWTVPDSRCFLFQSVSEFRRDALTYGISGVAASHSPPNAEWSLVIINKIGNTALGANDVEYRIVETCGGINYNTELASAGSIDFPQIQSPQQCLQICRSMTTPQSKKLNIKALEKEYDSSEEPLALVSETPCLAWSFNMVASFCRLHLNKVTKMPQQGDLGLYQSGAVLCDIKDVDVLDPYFHDLSPKYTSLLLVTVLFGLAAAAAAFSVSFKRLSAFVRRQRLKQSLRRLSKSTRRSSV